jgi:glycosyltransferase involved in cell wall biosynthesis
MSKKFKYLIVIPLYNHGAAVRKVAEEVLSFYEDVLIVDDGSGDNGTKNLEGLPLKTIVFTKNCGKGAAIMAAADWGGRNNFTHIVTIDADGQHYPSDIAKLLEAARQNIFSIVIGKRNFNAAGIPALSKFGRVFSGFWAKLQTGKTIVDIQSGFRVYPVAIFNKYKIFSRRFAFEVEIVIKALWSGFDVKEVDVGVHYGADRISHFSIIKDNFRLGILNTYLTIRSMIPIPHRKYLKDKNDRLISLNPFKVVVEQAKKDGNPFHAGISAAWGAFCGTLALPGIRTMILMLGAGWFNLNRAVAFSVDKLAMPPFIPFVCIETGYFIRHGKFLTEIGWQVLGRQFLQRVWEWFLGSLLIAPVFAILIGIMTYFIGIVLRKGLLYGSKMDGRKQK